MLSRRGFLRLTGSLVAGAGILILTNGLAGTELLTKGAQSVGIPISASADAANSRASLVSVRVYYMMMAQYTNMSEEEFVLESPATIQDLISTCILRHPWFSQMTGAMLMLLDGVPSEPRALLKDGDTVQFIPGIAGG